MRRIKNYGGALLFAGALALAACSGSSGSDGAPGTNGTNGTNGTDGTNGMNGVAGKLSLTIDGVATTTSGGTTTSTLTFTIYPAASVCPGGVCDPTLSNGVVGQKTFYAQEYNTATNTFDTAKNFSFGSIQFKGITADGNGAQYTATKASPPFTPETSASAYVFAYVTGLSAVPAPSTGHYYLPSSVASAAKVYGSAPAYTSVANVAGCEKCHGAPYSKHGYRQPHVAGLNDFVSCKVCHTDQRVGGDAAWYLTADDPATLAGLPKNANGAPILTQALKDKYAYTANLMNDVHNSHAFEFNFPQSMANCVTCHAGKLASILTDANFKPTTCKSCHPVTGVAGTEEGRAPSLTQLWHDAGTDTTTHKNFLAGGTFDLYTHNDANCNVCHSTAGGAPTFSTLHAGYNKLIYADANGTRYSDSIKAQVDSASYDASDASKPVATVSFSVVGVSTDTKVTPTVVASLYGYDTKDFIVSGHSSTPKLECTVTGTACTGALTVAAGTDPNTWVATIDLSTWANMISAGNVKRIEVGVLPRIGLDRTLPACDPSAYDPCTPTNHAIAVAGATQTIDVTKTATDAGIAAADSYGKAIVDPAKCNACHDALGTTFHNSAYGSAGTVGCRLCHFVGAGGYHIEMQSRSIDSWAHAIHSMQEFDINKINMTDPVQALRYNDHIEGNFPNFAGLLNCEACHNPGTYNVPDQARSLPSIISASSAFAGGTRNIGKVAGEITGPAARACGACHRAQLINEDNATSLAAFYAHTNLYSSNVALTGNATTDNSNFLDTAAYLEYLVGAFRPSPDPSSVAGAQVEQCTICHPTAGSDHQALFNTWKNGL